MPFRKRPGPTRPALPFTPPVGPYADCRHRQQRIAAERAASTDKRPGKNAPDIRRGNRVKRALQDRLSGRGSWSGLPEKDSRREAYCNDADYAVARRFSTPPSSAHALTTARHRHRTSGRPPHKKNGRTLAGCARQLFRRLGFHCQVSTVSGEQAELAPGQRMRSAARTISSSWKIARTAR